MYPELVVLEIFDRHRLHNRIKNCVYIQTDYNSRNFSRFPVRKGYANNKAHARTYLLLTLL